MPQLIELQYAWRDRGTNFNFTETAAIAQAVDQLVQQARGLPPSAIQVKPVEIQYQGVVEHDDPNAPDQLYVFYTSYGVPDVE